MPYTPTRITRLRRWITTKHVSRTQLATLSGLSESVCKRIVSGETFPTPAQKDAICLALGVEEAEVFSPFAGMSQEAEHVARLREWLKTDEAVLLVGRLARVVTEKD